MEIRVRQRRSLPDSICGHDLHIIALWHEKDLSERRERLGKVPSGVLHESKPIFFFLFSFATFLSVL